MPRHSSLTLVDRFISNRSHGYLIIEGAAGVGKTTFLAALARDRDWPAYFAREGPSGPEATTNALESVGAQLARRFGLARRDVLAASFESAPQRWYRLLELAVAASRAEPWL